MTDIGFISAIVSGIGLAFNANHRHFAQKVFIVGNVLWIVYGLANGLAPVVLSQLLYLALSIRTVRAWGRETNNGKLIIVEES